MLIGLAIFSSYTDDSHSSPSYRSSALFPSTVKKVKGCPFSISKVPKALVCKSRAAVPREKDCTMHSYDYLRDIWGR